MEKKKHTQITNDYYNNAEEWEIILMCFVVGGQAFCDRSDHYDSQPSGVSIYRYLPIRRMSLHSNNKIIIIILKGRNEIRKKKMEEFSAFAQSH